MKNRSDAHMRSYLKYTDRQFIERGLAAGESYAANARALGRSVSTIS
jgi:IS30 family transposase